MLRIVRTMAAEDRINPFRAKCFSLSQSTVKQYESTRDCQHTSPLSLLVGLSRGKVALFLSGSVPTEKCMGNCRRYRAPHQDFGSCREIGAKTHWGSIRSHFCARPAPRPADAKATVAECTCTVYGTRVCLRVQLCVLSFTRSIGTVYYGTAVVDPVQLY